MGRERTVPPSLIAPAHGDVEKRCVVMTETAIHTIGLAEGHFASIVLSRPTSGLGAIAILDRDDVEALVPLLRNAMDDAERLDRGEPAQNATPSLRRN